MKQIIQMNFVIRISSVDNEVKSGGTRHSSENPEPGGEVMDRIVIHSRVGADGVLRLNVPIGASAADGEVEVTIEAARVGPPSMTQEEWRDFVLTTAGSITDPSFVRHEQGEYERREELP
jgi:hypothetical protein